MLELVTTRLEAPCPEVFIKHGNNRTSPASQTLTDSVHEDIATSRESIIQDFGTDEVPGLSKERLCSIGNFFSEREWTVPQVVLIDPDRDALRLRAILERSNFRNPFTEAFFTGSNDAKTSPGADLVKDLVILHDLRSAYHAELQDYLDEYDLVATPQEMDETTEDKVSDLLVHELAHAAGHLAVSQIVLQRIDGGKYLLRDEVTSGFTTIRMNSTPIINERGDYYAGPLLDEGWAAYQSSRFLQSQNGEKRGGLEIEDRYWVTMRMAYSDKPNDIFKAPIAGLHSGEAGQVLEKIESQYPEIITRMQTVADGNLNVHDFLQQIGDTIPKPLLRNLLNPNYKAWLRAKKQVGL